MINMVKIKVGKHEYECVGYHSSDGKQIDEKDPEDLRRLEADYIKAMEALGYTVERKGAGKSQIA